MGNTPDNKNPVQRKECYHDKTQKKTIKGRQATHNVPPFAYELRLKVARLYVDDGYPAKLVALQFGISEYSVYRWGKNYRLYSEQGLVDRPKSQAGSRLPSI